MNNCPHCGMIHQSTCPRIKAIEYHPDGITVKRVEFHEPKPLATSSFPTVNIRLPDAPYQT